MSSAPTALLLAAAPHVPGARAALRRLAEAAAAGGPCRLLLAGGGLAWAAEADLAALLPGADVAVCSRNAREAGWTLESTPAGVRWSSVATWLAELDGEGRAALWTVLP